MALTLRRLAGLTLLVAVAGCPKPVSPPLADAGSGATVNTGQLVPLDGTRSSDPQNRDLTFTWAFASLPAGSAAALNDPHSQTPSFVADVPGVFKISLVVSNAFLASNPALVTITATSCGDSAPVTGSLQQSPAAPGVGSIVTLSAPAAADPDNTVGGACGTTPLAQKLSYQWRLIAQPASSTATLNNPTAIQPSFTPDVDGDYSFRLVITDSTGRSSVPQDLTVSISRCGEASPVISAILNNQERPGVGSNIQLSATVSNPDDTCAPPLNETLSYQWSIGTLPQGSHAALNSTTSRNPSFVPDVFGTYIFHLVVTSSNGRSAQLDSPALVIGSGCGTAPPTVGPISASTTPPTKVIGSNIFLSAAVSDPDALNNCGVTKIFSYAWAIHALPPGSLATLNNPASTDPSFVADVSGTYQVGLTVSDQFGHHTTASDLQIPVSPCGSAVPTVDSLTPENLAPNAGNTEIIDSTWGTTDNQPGSCGLSETVTYQWKLSSRPQGSNAFIVDPAAASATFVADVGNGSYQLSLTVTASNGKTSAPRFITVNTTTCGTHAPTIAAAAATPANPNPGTVVQLSATGADVDKSASCSPSLALSYSWALVSGPAGAALSNPNVASPTFTPLATNADYQFSVIATAPNGLSSAPTFVTIHTTTCGSATPTVAIVGSVNLTIDPTIQPQLSAQASSSDNGCLATPETFTYLWKVDTKPSDSRIAAFSDPTSPAPTFQADAPGAYQLEVRATASNGLTSDPAYVNVTVDTCGKITPSVTSIGFTGGTVGSAVNLSAGTITDNNCLLGTGPKNYLYSWALTGKPSGSQSLLSNPAAQAPGFVPDRAGTYQVSLVVTDTQGFSSQPIFQSVVAAPCGSAALTPGSTGHAQPLTFAFTDGFGLSSPHTGAQVSLAAFFSDPNSVTCGSLPVAPFSYQWALVASPTGSRAQLTSTSAPAPTFVPDVVGTYQVSFIATDALGNSLPTQFLAITTSSCGANVPVAAITPSAAQTSNSYVLDALSASVSDADNLSCPARFKVASFSYAWTVASAPPGSRSVLSSHTGATTNFEAFTPSAVVPPRSGHPEDYDFVVQLVATGSNGLSSAPVQLPFNVAACGSSAPVVQQISTTVTATGLPISRPPVGTGITLTASATDANTACGAPAPSYAWSIVSLPSGSTLSTAGASSAAFAFTPDVAGHYQLKVTVTDQNLLSDTLIASVDTAACGPAFTGISSGPTVNTVIGSAVALSTTAVTDNCVSSPAYSYAWSVLSRPAGSQATLTSATAVTSSLTPDAIGSYQVQAVVTDNAGFSSAPATLTINAATCGSISPTLAGLTANPSTPDAGTRVALAIGTVTDTNTCTGIPVQPYGYRWSLIAAPAGSAATLSNSAASSPTFVPDVPNGSYQFAVTVTDALGNASAPSFLTVKSSTCGANVPTVAIAQGASATANSNVALALGAAAADADSACSAGFATSLSTSWSIVSSPAGGHASLTTASGSATSFQASVPGTYTVQAVATSSSNGLNSAPALIAITVSGCGSNAPVISGVATTVGGVASSRPPVGAATVLTASSFDADTTAAVCTPTLPNAPVYTWTLVSAPAGSTASIPANQGGAAALAFIPNVAGTYVFSVTATDTLGLVSAPVTVTVPTGSCGPVLASGIAATGTLSIGNSIALATGAVSDACVAGGTLTFAWSVATRPAGSSAVIASPATAASSFTPDVAGTYGISLVVTDSGGFSTVTTASVNIGGCSSVPALTAAPMGFTATDAVTSATSTSVIDSGDRVQLNVKSGALTPGSCGSVSSSTFSYEWSLLSRPAGSQSTLAGATDAQPTFIPDTPNGTYQVLLVVKDSLGNASLPAVQSFNVSGCGGSLPTASLALIGTPSLNANSAVALQATSTVASNGACPAHFAETSVSNAFSIAAQPAGSVASLSQTSAPSNTPISFTANQAGTYTLQVIATGNDGKVSLPASLQLTIKSCGANPPVALKETTPTASPAFTATQTLTPQLQWTSDQAGSGTALDTNVAVQLFANVVSLDGLPGNATPTPGCGLTPRPFTVGWTLTAAPAGSTATLSNATTVNPTLRPDKVGSYTLQLVATDSLGYSSTQTMTFTTGTCGTGAPAATDDVGGPAFTAQQRVGATIITSTDLAATNFDVSFPIALSSNVVSPDAACTGLDSSVTYAWSFVSLAPGSAAQLSGASTATPSFTPDVTGAYSVQLTTTDARGNSATRLFPLSVTCGAAAPAVVETAGQPGFSASQLLPAINVLPAGTLTPSSITRTSLANAGVTNGTVSFYPGFPIQVSANVVDADTAACPAFAQTLSYAWSFSALPVGSLALLNSTSARSPSFTPDVAGEYDLQLTVTDSTGRSTTSKFALIDNTPGVPGSTPAISVSNCGTNTPSAGTVSALSPVAGSGTVTEPTGAIFLSATASSPADSAKLDVAAGAGCGLSPSFSYQWTVLTVPSGSTPALTGATQSTPTLTTDVQGTYTAQVTVSDGKHTSVPALITVLSKGAQVSPAGSPLMASALDPTTGKPVVALWDQSTGTGAVKLYRCLSGCDGAGEPLYAALAKVDDNLGAITFASPLDQPAPVDIKIAQSGTIYVAYYNQTSGPHTPGACGITLATSTTGGSSWTYSHPANGSGSGCTADNSSGTSVGRWLSLALDPSDAPYLASVSFVNATDASPVFINCAPAGTCGAATVTTAGGAGVAAGRFPQLDMSAGPSAARLAFQVNNGSVNIWVSDEGAPGNAWPVQLLAPGGYFIRTIGEANSTTMHLAWSNGAGATSTAFCTASTCTTGGATSFSANLQTLESGGAADLGRGLSIAADASALTIAYPAAGQVNVFKLGPAATAGVVQPFTGSVLPLAATSTALTTVGGTLRLFYSDVHAGQSTTSLDYYAP